jgi:hypothetical protein
VRVRRFDPNDDLIIVKARVFGKHRDRPFSLALDTAASHTHISSDIIDELGYANTPADRAGAEQCDGAADHQNADAYAHPRRAEHGARAATEGSAKT